MTVRKGPAAGLILGPACCWAFAATASAHNAAVTTAPTLELQQVTVTANFIRPGGQSALKMNVPVKDVPFALVDYGQSFMKAVDTTQLTETATLLLHHAFTDSLGGDINVRSVHTEDLEVGFVTGAVLKDASLEVSNLLDKRYYQSAFSDVRITPADPRELSLTLNKVFN